MRAHSSQEYLTEYCLTPFVYFVITCMPWGTKLRSDFKIIPLKFSMLKILFIKTMQTFLVGSRYNWEFFKTFFHVLQRLCNHHRVPYT